MRNILLGGVVLMAAAVVGCEQQQKPAQNSSIRPSALDVTGPAVSSTPTYRPASVTAPIEPAMTQTPVAFTSATPASGGGSYTVKKGDTFFSIAKEKYGSGKQWQRIASANPGVTPSSLKVGQTLVVPQ